MYYKICLVLMFLGSVHFSFAQTDSTDLTFEMGDVLYLDDQDSIFFPADLYSELTLAFDISDTTNFGEVHVEVSSPNGGAIFFKKTYSETTLTNEGLIEDWHCVLSFGNVVTEGAYKVSIVIEDYAGLQGPAIIKNY